MLLSAKIFDFGGWFPLRNEKNDARNVNLFMKLLEFADYSKVQVLTAHMLVGGMCSSCTSWKTSPEYGETPKSSRAKPSTTAKTEDDHLVQIRQSDLLLLLTSLNK